jgi:alkylhydroperoxidase/carboxymuconolactone decarboxylase family protein YurZ
MRDRLPEHFMRFKGAHPEIYEAFEELGRRLHESGPLSERERRLVKLGIAIGLGMEGGVHSAVRFALSGGCSGEDVRHVVRLAITTIGWPRAQAAMSWVEDLAGESEGGSGAARAGGGGGAPGRGAGATRGGGRGASGGRAGGRQRARGR